MLHLTNVFILFIASWVTKLDLHMSSCPLKWKASEVACYYSYIRRQLEGNKNNVLKVSELFFYYPKVTFDSLKFAVYKM